MSCGDKNVYTRKIDLKMVWQKYKIDVISDLVVIIIIEPFLQVINVERFKKTTEVLKLSYSCHWLPNPFP